METKELPKLNLDSETQKALFDKAVIERLTSLIEKIKKSIDPDQKMRTDYDDLKNVFVNPIIDPLLGSQVRSHRFQKLGSCKEDYWLQIKDIFLYRLNGNQYHYSLIDHNDIETLLNIYSEEIPQLYNEIWTQVYYEYFLYLKEHLELTLEEKSLGQSPEIELDLTEKMLIISYLQKFGKAGVIDHP